MSWATACASWVVTGTRTFIFPFFSIYINKYIEGRGVNQEVLWGLLLYFIAPFGSTWNIPRRPRSQSPLPTVSRSALLVRR